MGRRRKQSLVALATLAGALLAWFLLRADPAPEEGSGPRSASPAPLAQEAAREEAPTLTPKDPRKGPSGAPLPPLARLPPASVPVIDEVTVDKRSVCFNEDIHVSVKARAGGLDDAFLRYRVAGEAGPVVSLRRLSLPSKERPVERGGYTVTVTGRDGLHATVPLPDIEVKDCRVPNEFELVHHLEPGTDGVVRFVASPVGHNPNIEAVAKGGVDDAPRFEPVRYVWTFGDGTTVETAEGTVVHDFSARAQAGQYAYFLVRCEAHDAQGQVLHASKSLELKNPAFESFVKEGTVRLQARVLPAVAGEDGTLTVPVRLWHAWERPVTVKTVKLRRHGATELGRADEAHPPSRPAVEELFVGPALGATQVPASGHAFHVRFAPEADRDVAAKELRIEGETPEGWPARGTVVVVRPEVDPVVRRLLVDGDWRARVLRARTHLGRADVTEKEVMDLEGEGVYRGLSREFQGTPPPGFAPPEPVARAEDW
ncbi:PKD domain-containing protein [Myxococcaceae bacterium GXIMD 01537]